MGTIVSRIKAEDLDNSANLEYIIDVKSCEAKNEIGVLLKADDFDCANAFLLDSQTGILTVGKPLDREVVEVFRIGLLVEDKSSETGPQIDAGKSFAKYYCNNLIIFFFSMDHNHS